MFVIAGLGHARRLGPINDKACYHARVNHSAQVNQDSDAEVEINADLANTSDGEDVDQDEVGEGEGDPITDMTSPIAHLEDGVWHAPQGTGTKTVAWLILICLGLCIIGLIVAIIVNAMS